MPVLSLGGMRFQQSWSDLPAEQITDASQTNLLLTLQRAVDHGFHHVETARHYGSSERQLGWAADPEPGHRTDRGIIFNPTAQFRQGIAPIRLLCLLGCHHEALP